MISNGQHLVDDGDGGFKSVPDEPRKTWVTEYKIQVFVGAHSKHGGSTDANSPDKEHGFSAVNAIEVLQVMSLKEQIERIAEQLVLALRQQGYPVDLE